MNSEEAAELLTILRCYECAPPDIDWPARAARVRKMLEHAMRDGPQAQC
jgi:hypothetical protein